MGFKKLVRRWNVIVPFSYLLIFFFSIHTLPSCRKKEHGVTIPSVVTIYPTADTLPENLLRMYIHFSTSMKTIGNLEKISLVDEKNKKIDGAIFNNVYELWDSAQTQLTLIFDPARVKTGLDVHETIGRSLKKGHHYTLEIGPLEDINGKQTQPFSKTFFVIEEDLNPPDNDLWELKIPDAESKDKFHIQFPDMLDQLSSLQRIRLTNKNNQLIKGSTAITTNETTWEFTPSHNWLAGDYIVYVSARLEDPAGNNLNGLFDHKIGSLKYPSEDEIIQISFTIKN